MITTNPEAFTGQFAHPYTNAFDAMMWKLPIMSMTPDNANVSPGDLLKMPAAPARWPEFMNIATLAEYLDMSTSSVRKLIDSGIIPGASLVTSIRTKRWRKSEIDDVVARRVEARSKGPSLADLLQTTDAVPAKRKGR
jgi:predicted DNA-binding transcriptional regulator AlpA